MTGICGWFLAFLFFLGAECICRCLVSLWFVLGAFAAFVCAVMGMGTDACFSPVISGCISAYQAHCISGKISWKTFCKQRIFSQKPERR